MLAMPRWMLIDINPRMAKAVARKEYSVNLTVLPWLRIATGSLIMPAFACISLSRRTAMSTATGRLSRAGSLNVSVSWRIAHLLAVKYATVNTAESETRTVIPRFMFVLGAPTVGDHDHCAAHPCADAQSRKYGRFVLTVGR